MSPTVFNILLLTSLGICSAGILFKVLRWFVVRSGPSNERKSAPGGFLAFFKGFFGAIFSLKLVYALKAVFVDSLLQARVLRVNPVRWIMHFLIFAGFIALVLFHAMDELVTLKLDPGYQSTNDPYFFLRNLFGAMVLAGILVAVARRIARRGAFLRTRAADAIALTAVAVIILSGFFLDSAKIVSEAVYQRMVKEYYPMDNPNDVIALKAFWADGYGVVFKDMQKLRDPALRAKGKELHEQGCVSCHPHPRKAFLSYPLARLLSPAAPSLNGGRADIWAYWIHVIACFFCLAILPFTKLFHFISDPFSLIAAGVADRKKPSQDTAGPRRALEFDACINCGTCNDRCSVAPVYRIIGNELILPSQKLAAVKRLASSADAPVESLLLLSEGSHICTGCFKCTEFCPAGINLQDQWAASKKLLAEMGHPAPQVWIRDAGAARWSDVLRNAPPAGDGPFSPHLWLTRASPESFTACVQCQTCTSVCPVVAANVSEERSVDVTPQKIMNLLRMGMVDMAAATRMSWDCVTCYQCQENCPQSICVTDILYELKNIAYERLRTVDRAKALAETPEAGQYVRG